MMPTLQRQAGAKLAAGFADDSASRDVPCEGVLSIVDAWVFLRMHQRLDFMR